MHNNPSTTHPPKPKTLTSKNIRRNRRRRRSHKQYGPASTSSQSNQLIAQQFPYSMNPNGFQLWRKTYENIMHWQSEHQVNYWRNQAQHFRNINQELWTKLQEHENQSINTQDKIPEYETSSSEEDDSDNNKAINNQSVEIDEEYLKFLEITHKHQNDRKLLQTETDEKT